MTEEQYKEIKEKAKVYAYNVMHDDDYTNEKYEADLDKVKNAPVEEKPYTDYDEINLAMNMEHLVQGYATYGKDYLTAVISKDLNSAVVMFECAVQQVLDLTNMINQFTTDLEAHEAELKSTEIHNDMKGGE